MVAGPESDATQKKYLLDFKRRHLLQTIDSALIGEITAAQSMQNIIVSEVMRVEGSVSISIS